MGRSPCCSKDGLNRGAWTFQEDKKLKTYIKIHGEGNWISLPKKAGLKRCGKGCRLRWMNYLRPDIKRGNITSEETDLIIRLHNLLGNRWSLIAGRLPGRTDNEIKNYWNTTLCKQFGSRSCGRSTSKRTTSSNIRTTAIARKFETEANKKKKIITRNINDLAAGKVIHKNHGMMSTNIIAKDHQAAAVIRNKITPIRTKASKCTRVIISSPDDNVTSTAAQTTMQPITTGPSHDEMMMVCSSDQHENSNYLMSGRQKLDYYKVLLDGEYDDHDQQRLPPHSKLVFSSSDHTSPLHWTSAFLMEERDNYNPLLLIGPEKHDDGNNSTAAGTAGHPPLDNSDEHDSCQHQHLIGTCSTSVDPALESWLMGVGLGDDHDITNLDLESLASFLNQDQEYYCSCGPPDGR